MVIGTQAAFTVPVLVMLRADRAALPSQARSVADVILADPLAASRMQIQELASQAGVSEASVTRLAQRLGRKGFPEMRLALAAESAARHEHVVGDIALEDPLNQVKSKLLVDLEQSLRDTAAALDDAAVAEVATAIIQARRTVIVGVGASGIVALDLASKLERIGLLAVALTEYHQAITTSVGLSPSDVVVGISHSGETVDVTDPMDHATARGATTVAITSAPRSALARRCDHVLRTVAGTETSFRPAAMTSRAAQLYVVDVLFVAVVQRDHERAAQHLSTTWDALRSRHPGRSPSTRSPKTRGNR